MGEDEVLILKKLNERKSTIIPLHLEGHFSPEDQRYQCTSIAHIIHLIRVPMIFAMIWESG